MSNSTVTVTPTGDPSITGLNGSLYANVTSVSGGVSNLTYPYYTAGTGVTSVAGFGDTITLNPAYDNNVSRPSLTVKGQAHFEDDIFIQGRSLSETLEKIEQRLKIASDIKFDPELEKKWEDLRTLGEQYRAMLDDVKEKEEIWRQLNQ
jgi:hypothetical protein